MMIHNLIVSLYIEITKIKKRKFGLGRLLVCIGQTWSLTSSENSFKKKENSVHFSSFFQIRKNPYLFRIFARSKMHILINFNEIRTAIRSTIFGFYMYRNFAIQWSIPYDLNRHLANIFEHCIMCWIEVNALNKRKLDRLVRMMVCAWIIIEFNNALFPYERYLLNHVLFTNRFLTLCS